MQQLELLGGIAIAIPVTWYGVGYVLARQGAELWKPPKSLLLHTYIGIMLCLGAVAFCGYYGSIGRPRLATFGAIGIMMVALVYFAWYSNRIEQREHKNLNDKMSKA